uniref:Glutaredoxin 2 n=1 Tax=Populus trichocarpa TaxID=3694 RepID=A0A509GJ91_POPTR|nr:glutaredoxin 2 [Populus trichocarpa]
MQGLRQRCSDDVDLLDLSSPLNSSSSSSLSIDEAESTETRIQRLISEHPVIIFSRSSCCMCHVMKKLLATIGVHPTKIYALPPAAEDGIGGTCVGGLESLVALHLSGHLVPKLVELGVLAFSSGYGNNNHIILS